MEVDAASARRAPLRVEVTTNGRIEPVPEAAFVNPPADTTLTCDEAQNFTVNDLSYTNGEYTAYDAEE